MKYKNKNRTQDATSYTPTNFENEPDKLNIPFDEKLLYSLIWNFTLASQVKAALYEVVTVKAEMICPEALKLGRKGRSTRERF